MKASHALHFVTVLSGPLPYSALSNCRSSLISQPSPEWLLPSRRGNEPQRHRVAEEPAFVGLHGGDDGEDEVGQEEQEQPDEPDQDEAEDSAYHPEDER